MANSLFTGDKIIVSKLKYGPRMPNSPFKIPWVNLFFYFSTRVQEKIDAPWSEYNRLEGFGRVERNDVLVFNHVDNANDHYIKRCIGLPGDTLEIRNGVVYINHKKSTNLEHVKFRYKVWYNARQKTIDFLNDQGMSYYQIFKRSRANSLEMNLTKIQALELGGESFIDSLDIKITPVDSVPKTFPWDAKFSWTAENFGPFVIPGKAMKVILDKDNIELYRKVIKKFDNGEGDRAEIDNELLKSGELEYIFQNDYYFMMGDNRHNSNDSRFWGLVPEHHIIGNATVVLFSTNTTNMGWGRVLKIIE